MAANPNGRTTPWGLVTFYLLGGVVAALLGTTPLAAWIDAFGSTQDVAALRDLAAGMADLRARTGLDRPYKALHEAVKTAEAARFFGAR